MLASKPRSPSPAFTAPWASLNRQVPRRFCRWSVVGFLLALVLTLHILLKKPTRQHHEPWQVPVTGTVVHGKKPQGPVKELYPLDPFPYSPKLTSAELEKTKPANQYGWPRPWLAAVICAAQDAQSRMKIRSTWMHLYRDVPFDGRFVVANPGPRWTPMVALENRTFGDMIVLDHIQEDDVTANTIKTLELYKWLSEPGRPVYEFVSKMDTDLWLNARGFWDRFLVPRLASDRNDTLAPLEKDAALPDPQYPLVATVERTIIGELYYSQSWDLVFPHGAMYTMTWDMIGLLVKLQDRFHVVTGEDMAVAALMLKGHETANFVNFRGSEKFDYDPQDTRGDGTAWARAGTHPNASSHALTPGGHAIAVHDLKDTESWFRVAQCFDEKGAKEPPALEGTEPSPSTKTRWFDFWHQFGKGPRRYKNRFESIPEPLWTFEKGQWFCDNIWNLGSIKTGFSGEGE